jgi:NDP-sugar pyrophosphorylase family protein
MTKPALLILAAGLGSRYGSLKQIEPVGPGGEAILDYSVYDAIRAGFGKVVFVIKRDIEAEFREVLLKRFEDRIETAYVFQDPDMLPKGYSLPPERKKPWGTAHAILAAEHSISSPFAAINADDFYGPEAFTEMQKFLAGEIDETEYSMIGYKLKNTLSLHGTVARGVCDLDDNNFLRSVSELTRIQRENGRIVYYEDDESYVLSEDSVVSMNMWGFTPTIFRQIRQRFPEFLDENSGDPKAEYFISSLVDKLIRAGEARVKVLHCDADWFGITYREDREAARKSILEKIEGGKYPAKLWK